MLGALQEKVQLAHLNLREGRNLYKKYLQNSATRTGWEIKEKQILSCFLFNHKPTNGPMKCVGSSKKVRAECLTLTRRTEEKINNLQFSVMTTSHISFRRVMSSWSATTNTPQTNSTFRDSVEQRTIRYSVPFNCLSSDTINKRIFRCDDII